MEWRYVDGTGDHYSVSNEGLVRSEDRYVPHRNSFAFRKGKILKPYKTGSKRNYLKVDIHGKSEAVHRLVALAFIPNPENKPEVNHIDGDTFNNHFSNLEWVTGSENVQHAINLGLLVRGSGEKCYNTKRRVAVLQC